MLRACVIANKRTIKQHEDGISKTDPAQAITNGLQAVTGKLALKLVKQSHYDVMSWLYTG